MQTLLSIFLAISSFHLLLAEGQCDNTLPDGNICGEEDYVWAADPESCWKYYECDLGCVTHETCPYDNKFDIQYGWCTYPYDVECGTRPCNDAVHCPDPLTKATAMTTTTEELCPPGYYPQEYNCSTPGYYPDEFNCRGYWHCFKGDSKGQHMLCPDDDKGNPEVFDIQYDGCNFLEYTSCGQRPVCDECNQNCGAPGTTAGPFDCGHDLDCSSKPDGWYPDPYSCPKYWQCTGGVASHFICAPGLMYDPMTQSGFSVTSLLMVKLVMVFSVTIGQLAMSARMDVLSNFTIFASFSYFNDWLN